MYNKVTGIKTSTKSFDSRFDQTRKTSWPQTQVIWNHPIKEQKGNKGRGIKKVMGYMEHQQQNQDMQKGINAKDKGHQLEVITKPKQPNLTWKWPSKLRKPRKPLRGLWGPRNGQWPIWSSKPQAKARQKWLWTLWALVVLSSLN